MPHRDLIITGNFSHPRLRNGRIEAGGETQQHGAGNDGRHVAVAQRLQRYGKQRGEIKIMLPGKKDVFKRRHAGKKQVPAKTNHHDQRHAHGEFGLRQSG